MLNTGRRGDLMSADATGERGVRGCFPHAAALGADRLRALIRQRFEIGGGVGWGFRIIRCPDMPGCDSADCDARGFGCRLERSRV